jgi:CRP-like cAMP-binding protein
LAGCDIGSYLEFVEINPGETLKIENARIRVSSALHSVPTIRFEAIYGLGRSRRSLKIAYSADTCLDRAKIEAMYRENVIGARRRDELLRFGLDADLLIHEAGQESIHTPVEEFGHFPERVRKRLILVHTGASPGDFEGLRVAEEGETVELIPSERSPVDKVKLIASSSIFEDLDRESLVWLAVRSVVIPFRAGQNIVNEGETGDRFYVITRGKAKVVVGDAIKAVLGKGDYFGETALLRGDTRSATVQAISDGSVLALDKEAFLEWIQAKPSVHKRLENVLRVRPIFSQLTFLRGLSSDQLARLSIRVTRSVRRKGDRVVREGERGDAFFVLASGKATVRVKDRGDGERVVADLGPGDVFGEIALLEGIPRTATVEIASDSAEVLRLRGKDFRRLMESIPSLSFCINRISSERLRKLRRVHREDFHDRVLKELG